MNPAMPEKNTMPVNRPPVNARLRNRLGTIRGSPPARLRRDWNQPKTANTSTDAASMTNAHAGQSFSRPCTSG